MIKTLSIEGLRGFSKQVKIDFAVPNGTPGSGLNIIVGPNNSGKSTIIESINAFNGSCSFSEGKRNKNVANGVKLECIDSNNDVYQIKTKPLGGSEVEYLVNGNSIERITLNTYVLPSRRFVEFEFGKDESSKENYVLNNGFKNRKAHLDFFNWRLFGMQKNKTKIDQIMSQVVGTQVQWTIDQHDNGSYYVRFQFGNHYHSSEGVGDGLWSILTICDSLYDLDINQTLVIDEPELSLHPFYQKRLMKLLLEYSQNRQIIISTHSPYFIDWEAISNGAALVRTCKEADNSISIHQLSQNFKNNVNSLISDVNNPHVLGIDANEIFFAEDNIVLTEGQEDVVALNKVNQKLGKTLNGYLFGWGCGGASKESIILQLFFDLGFEKVVAIFDGDKPDELEKCRAMFPQYKYFILPTDDIRDKNERVLPKKEGMLTTSMDLKPQFKAAYEKLINDINQALK